MKKRFKRLWLWLRREIFVKDMILYIAIAQVIFWSPVIVTAILAVTINSWFWTVSVSMVAFWAGPFTPAIPLQMGLAVLIKKIFERK